MEGVVRRYSFDGPLPSAAVTAATGANTTSGREADRNVDLEVVGAGADHVQLTQNVLYAKDADGQSQVGGAK